MSRYNLFSAPGTFAALPRSCAAPLLSGTASISPGSLIEWKHNGTVRLRRLFLPIRLPPPVLTRLHERLAHARLRSHPRPRKGGGRGFLPFGSPMWCSANKSALPSVLASESVAWIREKPRTKKDAGLAYRFRSRSSFVTGAPAPPGDANREGTAFRGRQSDMPMVEFQSLYPNILHHTTSDKGVLAVGDSCIAEN